MIYDSWSAAQVAVLVIASLLAYLAGGILASVAAWLWWAGAVCLALLVAVAVRAIPVPEENRKAMSEGMD